MKFYVVADDFGYCPERNRAILVGFSFRIIRVVKSLIKFSWIFIIQKYNPD